MSTTFYFTSALTAAAISGAGGPLTINVTWSGVGTGPANSGLEMDTVQGTVVRSISGVSLAQTAGQNHLCQIFVSRVLDEQTLNAATWTIVCNAVESLGAMNFWLSGAASISAYGYLYRFRPTATNVLIASGKILGYNEAGTALTLESGTMAGDSVTLNSGDRIVFEFWWASGTQVNANARTGQIEFNSGNFGYISVPQVLAFVGSGAQKGNDPKPYGPAGWRSSPSYHSNLIPHRRLAR